MRDVVALRFTDKIGGQPLASAAQAVAFVNLTCELLVSLGIV